MKKILLLVLASGVLGSCTVAKMAIDPALKANSHEYKTEMPGLTGDTLRFGPYMASKIDRSFMRGGSTRSLGAYKSMSKRQHYTFNFTGKRSWQALCFMGKRRQSVGTVWFKQEVTLDCSFNLMGKNKTVFRFNLTGLRLLEAEGKFSLGTKNATAAVATGIEGTSLNMGTPSGFALYSGNETIAGVDITSSSGGPLWLHKNLSADEKDRVGLVMVAMLLLKV